VKGDFAGLPEDQQPWAGDPAAMPKKKVANETCSCGARDELNGLRATLATAEAHDASLLRRLGIEEAEVERLRATLGLIASEQIAPDLIASFALGALTKPAADEPTRRTTHGD
jgi:hypothetical protein